MIITPYSGLTIPNTRANFPALAHCFEFNEASGVDAFADSAGGMIIGTNAPDASCVNNGDGTITLPGNELTQSIRSGTWTVPGTKKVLMIFIGKGASGNAIMGKAANVLVAADNAIKLSVGSGTPQVANGTTLATGTGNVTAVGGMEARALVCDWGSATGLQPYDYNGTTYTTRAATTLATISGLTSVGAGVSLTVNMRPALWAILHFTTLPPDIKAGVAWMRDYTNSTGKKQIYPGWRNLAS